MLSKVKLSEELNRLGCNEYQICLREETGSTNEDAKQIASLEAWNAALVVADRQTNGKGRRGRSWETKEGSSVAMSLLIKPAIKPCNASMLTLVMALSVAETVKDMINKAKASACAVNIKWPNDILINRRKVCGILTEMSVLKEAIAYVVIGVGINVNELKFSEEITKVATSLRKETGMEFDREEIIASVVNNYNKYFTIFGKNENLTELKDIYEDLLVNKGKTVLVLDPKEEYSGQALGINDMGELLVRKEDGTIETVYAGEVSVRGVYGYAE